MRPILITAVMMLGAVALDGGPDDSHWAFVPPTRPLLPAVADSSWGSSPLDAFVLARLETEGLAPAPEAERTTLLRRLSLDLIGLPPTIEEIDTFLGDSRPDAYDRQVERLLESPHYGEKWARHWLDAARYADSDGFEKDKPRQVWFYRDWVVRSLNRDLPYDRFVVEQIAGDLLPNAAQDSLVATGFLRNSMVNEEGGIDPEQFRMEAMFDRMDAVGKAVLGLTFQCSQCHDHKYDPLTQVDYYRMFAYLNNCHEAQVTVYTDEEQEEQQALFDEVAAIEKSLRASMPDWRARMTAWEKQDSQDRSSWTVVQPEFDGSGSQKYSALADGSILAQGYAPTKHTTEIKVDTTQRKLTAFRLEYLNDPNLPHRGPGRSPLGLCALTEFDVTLSRLETPDESIEAVFSETTADANPSRRPLESIFDDKSDKERVTGPIEYANDGDELTAWCPNLGPGRSNVPHNAVFVLDKPLESEKGFRITFNLVQKHGGWNSDDNQNNNLGRFRLSVTSDDGAVADPVPTAVREVLAVPHENRSRHQVELVFSHWRTTMPQWRQANDRIEALWSEHPTGTTQLVALEREEPRASFRLERGEFLNKKERVTPGVPSFLHSIDESNASGRLRFARWLVQRNSPTAARAMVNRVWQSYFGTGLVNTPEDLGTQGESPSHPRLLDWLAVEFMDADWSLKQLHRVIVCSSTYRQSSYTTQEFHARDPGNRRLARGPRFRVDGETVRDIALAASGLLTRSIGGPSVYPPAPDFLFQPPTSYGPKVWSLDEGADRYRRALYTFRFRSVPYPVLQNFDAPNGDFSCVRRPKSNTPLQALTTLNEELFLECARALAVQTVTGGGRDDAQRLAFAFRRCVSRAPEEREIEVLGRFLDAQRERFRAAGPDSWPLILGEAEKSKDALASRLPDGVAIADVAAWTALARVVLNLDETITKE